MAFSLSASFKDLRRSLSDFLKRKIWQSSALADRGPRGRIYALLRIFSIILDGFTDNRLLSRSAALSYYSLIALGPLVAIVVMVSGYVIDQNDSDLTANSLNRILQFIAPPITEMSQIADEQPAGNESPQSTYPTDPATDARLNPQLVSFLDNIIGSARSGAVGAVGLLLLILIGIQLLTSIEKTFNEIWGVRRGRSWFQRTVFYWTFISLGAVLGLASVTLLSASTLAGLFNVLPYGDILSRLIIWLGPLLSFVMVMAVLIAFYRFIPNTSVLWRPALAGAFFVACLLFLNNYLSFIYVHRVITSQSLYGSLGIIPVLMVGLYIFWFFILIGGQITYSVQNADYLTNRQAWADISVHTRETLSLAIFLIICRRFKDCLTAPSASEIGEIIRAPSHLLNECFNRLCDLSWINPTTTTEKDGSQIVRYQPARPLNNITLAQFKQSLEHYGNDTGAELICESDPIIEYYLRHLDSLTPNELRDKTLDSLLQPPSSS